jgi:hypothetical protein
MDWKTILPLVVGTGLLSSLATAILTLTWGWWTKRSENKRNAAYLAIRLVVILERFAIDSNALITDQTLYDQSGGEYGANAHTLPDLETFPEEQSWITLQPTLLARVLTFPNELRLSNLAVASWTGSEDVIQEALNQCGKLGYRAWALAHDLRTQYRLPFDPASNLVAVAKVLKRRHDETLRRIAENVEVER